MPTTVPTTLAAERVMLFIDGSNIFWAARARGLYIDYVKLKNLLVGTNRRLVRPYYYCAIGVPPKKSQISFHDRLKYSGFTVVTKPLKRRVSKARLLATFDPKSQNWTEKKTRDLVKVEKEEEKGVDVALVTDMLSMAYKNAYDTAILVGGDEDYLSAVEDIKMIPKRVEIAAFNDTDTHQPPRWISTISREMIMIADCFYPLEKYVDQIKL
jgi:uncharacterized LabA/DUF88 family protein